MAFVFYEDEHENAQYIHLDMNEESLNVSWNQLSGKASFMEYVVQYKQAGSPPCQEFDWARVKKNHTKTFFKGLSDLNIFIYLVS